jgi:hypothetical protein
MPSSQPPKEAVKLAQRATGSTDAWCELCLDAAYPAILADLKERLLSEEAIVAAGSAASAKHHFRPHEQITRTLLEAAFNQAMEGEVFAEIDAEEFEHARRDPRYQALGRQADKHLAQLRGEGRIDSEAGNAGSGPEASERCGGSGNLTTKVPHGENLQPCPGCPDCKPEGETDHA